MHNDFAVFVRHLAAPVLLGKPFIDQLVMASFQRQKVVSYDNKPVQTLMLTMQTAKDEQEDNEQKHLILFMESDNLKTQNGANETTDKSVTSVPMHGTYKH